MRVGYARQHTPAVVFIDEIDAIGSKRRENVFSCSEGD